MSGVVLDSRQSSMTCVVLHCVSHDLETISRFPDNKVLIEKEGD